MTSETVKAAQRLLAERERFGLAKYGTTVDRTDLQAGDWLRHAIEEVSDLLLYLMRLEQTMRICEGLCGPTMEITDTPDVLTMQPTPAAAPEDAERAAYLARWKDAPEWAEWLSQDFNGRCDFWEVEPSLFADAEWVSSDGEPLHTDRKTAENLLGSVRCEPRPQPVEDPERAAYLERWKDAPKWANFRSEHDGRVTWWAWAHESWKVEPRPVQGVGE